MFFSYTVSSTLELLIILTIIGLIVIAVGILVIKGTVRLHDYFTFKWAYTNKEGRVIQVFSFRRSIKSLAKISKRLKRFDLRVIDNNEVVSLLEDKDCLQNVWAYDSISQEWLRTVRLPGGVKTIERSKAYPEILPDVTLIGVTKIHASLRVGPILIPQQQAVAQ